MIETIVGALFGLGFLVVIGSFVGQNQRPGISKNVRAEIQWHYPDETDCAVS